MGTAHRALDADGVVIKAITTSDGHRRAVLAPTGLPNFVRKLSEDQHATLSLLQHASADLIAAQDRVHDLVAAARHNGISWNVVAWSLGLSTSAVHQRFRHVDHEDFDPEVDI